MLHQDKYQLRALVKTYGPANQTVVLEKYCPQSLFIDHVRIQMLYAAINPSDLITVSGAYQNRFNLPFVPGFEGVGKISDIGSMVTNLQSGQTVLPIGSMGAWQTSRDIESKWCLTIPDNLQEKQIATGYVNPMTAFLLLTETLSQQDNIKIIINAGNSAIGRMLIRIANSMAIYPIVIMRNKPETDFLADCVTEQILISSENNYQQKLNTIHQHGGVDVIYDCIGGGDALISCTALKKYGKFINYGLLSGKAIPTEFWAQRPDIDFSYFHLRHWIHNNSHEMIQNKIDQVMQLIKSGIIYTKIVDIFELSQLPLVLDKIMTRKIKGKVLIKCSH